MKWSYLATSTALGIFVYGLLLCVMGPVGISNYQQLADYKTRVEKNLESMRYQQILLKEDIDSILSDPKRLKLEAIRLGMVSEGMVAIRYLEGSNSDISIRSPGAIPIRPEQDKSKSTLIAGISLSAALLLLFLQVFIGMELKLVREGTSRALSRRDQRTRISVYGNRSQTASLE